MVFRTICKRFQMFLAKVFPSYEKQKAVDGTIACMDR